MKFRSVRLEYKLLQFFMTHQDRVYTRANCSIMSGVVMYTLKSVPLTYISVASEKALGPARLPRSDSPRTGYRFSTKAS